jgi:hypothetical protein
MDAQRDADGCYAGEEDDPGPGGFVADMAMGEEDGSDDQIEQAPKGIDEGRGESLTRRFGKGGRKFVA